eukprot:15848764-Heterocapsa_arctica.AAC.1
MATSKLELWLQDAPGSASSRTASSQGQGRRWTTTSPSCSSSWTLSSTSLGFLDRIRRMGIEFFYDWGVVVKNAPGSTSS